MKENEMVWVSNTNGGGEEFLYDIGGEVQEERNH
jgi:hypothetical protein